VAMIGKIRKGIETIPSAIDHIENNTKIRSSMNTINVDRLQLRKGKISLMTYLHLTP
jgi:hypothetical protein